MKRIVLLCVVLIFIGGCASGGKGRSSYDELYAQARSETNVAKQMGFLWRDTEVYLIESRQAFERGDKKKATGLARKALEQAQAAQQQAREQANAGPYYPSTY
ncbi:MAG: hypothetical protein ACE5LB_16255 [Acidiferrobacterales bacterium]